MLRDREELEEALEDLIGSFTVKTDAKGRMVIYTKLVEKDNELLHEDELNHEEDEDYGLHEEDEDYEDEEDE